MKTPQKITIVVGLLAFLVNPGFGCSEDDFGFGEQEMRAVVEGPWRVTAPDETFVVELRAAAKTAMSADPPGWIRAANACGDRDFFSSAGACVEATTLHLVGTVAATSAGSGNVTGSFRVLGRQLAPGLLELALPDGGTLSASMVDTVKTSFSAVLSGGSR